jgi:hypothetical protein
MLFTFYVCTSRSDLFAVLERLALRTLLNRTLSCSLAMHVLCVTRWTRFSYEE